MLAFVVGGILVCTMFFLVISVFFDYGLLAVSGGYYCGHSLLTFANFHSVKRSCGSTMFIDCFTGVLSRLHCHVLRVIYTGHVFPYFRRYICSPSRIFPSRISAWHSLLPLAKFSSGRLHCPCVRPVGHVMFPSVSRVYHSAALLFVTRHLYWECVSLVFAGVYVHLRVISSRIS